MRFRIRSARNPHKNNTFRGNTHSPTEFPGEARPAAQRFWRTVRKPVRRTAVRSSGSARALRFPRPHVCAGKFRSLLSRRSIRGSAAALIRSRSASDLIFSIEKFAMLSGSVHVRGNLLQVKKIIRPAKQKRTIPTLRFENKPPPAASLLKFSISSRRRTCLFSDPFATADGRSSSAPAARNGTAR